MNDQNIKLILGAAAAVGIAIGGYYATRKYLPIVRNRITNWLSNDRHLIRDRVTNWLDENNLNETALTDLVYICDSVAGFSNKILCRVYAKTEKTGKVKVYEEEISVEELQKVAPDIAKQLIQKMSQEETSIMKQIFV